LQRIEPWKTRRTGSGSSRIQQWRGPTCALVRMSQMDTKESIAFKMRTYSSGEVQTVLCKWTTERAMDGRYYRPLLLVLAKSGMMRRGQPLCTHRETTASSLLGKPVQQIPLVAFIDQGLEVALLFRQQSFRAVELNQSSGIEYQLSFNSQLGLKFKSLAGRTILS
jgi:hypothetical protein